jgi:hypothetical protein
MDLRCDERHAIRSVMNPPPERKRPIYWRNLAALLVGLFACTAMLGDALRIPSLKGVGAASAIAPCPKVFCDTRGLEAFASDFRLRFETNGVAAEVELTPELYSKLHGPYNRRNVYGAALSFAPRLPEPLWRAAFAYALAPHGPLRKELGLPATATNLTVTIRTRTRGRSEVWELRQP